MNSPHVVYKPRPDATPETEISALRAVYKLVLERKKAVEPAPEPDSRDDTKEPKNDGAITTNYT